ncbi:TIGR04076 family protein [Microbacter sp. GSS18]|nr:TIGR04076 family protein [Microbacter sp. GSS18]
MTGAKAQHIRAEVESTSYSMCGYAAGDSFDIVDGKLVETPQGGICLYILNQVLGLMAVRPEGKTTEEWIRTERPATTCADGPERTVVRLSMVDD